MYSWHRNSILKLFEYIIFSICMIIFLTKLFFTEFEDETPNMQKQLTPILVLCTLIAIMISCTKHKNTVYWAIIIFLVVAQSLNFEFKINEKYMYCPILMAVLVVDFYYLKISAAKIPQPFEARDSNNLTTNSRSYSDFLTTELNIQTNLRKKQQRESECHSRLIRVYLVLTALLSITSTCCIYYSFYYNPNVKVQQASLIIKSWLLVPFLTFEYYLIMFEHIFVDSAHYLPQTQSLSFLASQNNSPKINQRSRT